jgi:hypothetical protein
MRDNIDPKDFLSIKIFNTTEDLKIKGGCKQKERQKVKVKGGTTIIRQQVKVKNCDCEI